MKKYRNPKESIESGGNSKKEQAYIKFPREGLIPVTENSDSYSVKSNQDIMKKHYGERGYKKFTHVHTHPHSGKYRLSAMPSEADLNSFYLDNRRKNMVIAQRDEESGEVQGYTFIARGQTNQERFSENKRGILSRFKRFYKNDNKQREKELEKVDQNIEINKKKFSEYGNRVMETPKEAYSELQIIAKGQGWRTRFVPAKGYRFSKETGNFEKESGLEKAVASLIVGFSAGLIFINSPSINGNTIVEEIHIFNPLIFVLIFSSIFSGIIYFLLRKQ
jgi:hypothetical protein